MFLIATPLLIFAGLTGVLVLFGVGTLLFQAGCVLADVRVRGYLRSLPVYSLAAVVCVPLIAALLWYAGRFETDPNALLGGARIVALMVALLLTWIISSGIYMLLLSASFRKGLTIAGVELLLMGLLAALVAAAVMVVLAIVQILGSPPPVKAARAPLPIVRLQPPSAPS